MVRSVRKIVRMAITGAERDRVLAALAAGAEPKAIAAAEGCAVGRIYFIRGQYGPQKAHPVEDDAPEPVAGVPAPCVPVSGVPLDLAATGGKYGPLRAYAEAHGLTFMQAQADWHRAQRGLAPIERGPQ